VVSFGVGFLRNASPHLQGDVKKAAVAGGAGTRAQSPLWRVPVWLPALVTADPGEGASGTLPGLGGSSKGMGVEPSPGV